MKSCPFCGSPDIKVVGVYNGRYSTYYAFCKCGVRGKGSSNSAGEHVAYEEAKDYWNCRKV